MTWCGLLIVPHGQQFGSCRIPATARSSILYIIRLVHYVKWLIVNKGKAGKLSNKDGMSHSLWTSQTGGACVLGMGGAVIRVL